MCIRKKKNEQKKITIRRVNKTTTKNIKTVKYRWDAAAAHGAAAHAAAHGDPAALGLLLDNTQSYYTIV